VAPGKTYRYRMMVAVNNPAFARTSALVKEQQDLAGSPLVYSAASQWSEPIQVMADQYYFVTSARRPTISAPPGRRQKCSGSSTATTDAAP
jgi:hypothetical protein